MHHGIIIQLPRVLCGNDLMIFSIIIRSLILSPHPFIWFVMVKILLKYSPTLSFSSIWSNSYCLCKVWSLTFFIFSPPAWHRKGHSRHPLQQPLDFLKMNVINALMNDKQRLVVFLPNENFLIFWGVRIKLQSTAFNNINHILKFEQHSHLCAPSIPILFYEYWKISRWNITSRHTSNTQSLTKNSSLNNLFLFSAPTTLTSHITIVISEACRILLELGFGY